MNVIKFKPAKKPAAPVANGRVLVFKVPAQKIVTSAKDFFPLRKAS